MLDDTNKTLGSSGAGQIVTVDGVEYTLLPADKGIQAAFQAWMEGLARMRLVDAQRQLIDGPFADDKEREASAKVYGAMLDKTAERIDTGHYSWGKSAWADKVRTIDGAVRLAWLMMKPTHPTITREQVEELFKTEPEQFSLVLNTFVKATVNPKAKAGKEGGP